jgi:hypothetical protein
MQANQLKTCKAMEHQDLLSLILVIISWKEL